MMESRIASATASRKTDGSPVHLFSENKMGSNYVLLKKKDTARNQAQNHLDTLLPLLIDSVPF